MADLTGGRKSADHRARHAVSRLAPRMLVLVLALFLGACGLPPALQIASWITNGISYLTTNKSISDHGISLVSGRDCAVHRSLAGNDVCRDVEEGEAMMASLDSLTDSPLAPEAVEGEEEPAAALAAMDLAAGPLNAAPAEPEPADAGPPPSAEPPAPGASQHAARRAATAMPRHGDERAATGQDTEERQIADTEKPGGVYYSLASFSVLANARRLIRRNGGLSPALMTARVNGRNVYRVVVGPVTRSGGKALRQEIASAGFRDAWALWAAPPQKEGDAG